MGNFQQEEETNTGGANQPIEQSIDQPLNTVSRDSVVVCLPARRRAQYTSRTRYQYSATSISRQIPATMPRCSRRSTRMSRMLPPFRSVGLMLPEMPKGPHHPLRNVA